MDQTDDILFAEIIALECAALDRWSQGDPQGYIDIFAEDVTYFDPALEKRIDGFTALRDYLAPFTGKIKIDRYEMVEPKVQRHGDAAVLTFNLINYARREDGTEGVLVRWNSTEAYARIEGRWGIVHSHWSYVKPELKQPLTVY
jgi:ketosteroid isomerase-like protein